MLLSVLVVLATGCAGTSTPPPGASSSSSQTSSPSSDWRTYHSHKLTFRYPPGSGVRRYRDITPAYDSLAYISNQQMTNPCRTTSTPGVTECALAVDQLRAGGFVAVWRIHGLPVGSFATLPGRVTRVSGRLAKLVIERPGDCRSVGADVTVDAVVKPAGPGTWYEFRGCVRGPDTRSLVRQTMNILRSTALPA
jgi:hypothetical protein